MKTVIGVKFRGSNKVYYFDPGDLTVSEGDGVIVETSRGVEFGDVMRGPHEVEDSQIFAPLKMVQRIATPKDHEMRALYIAKEKDAHAVAFSKIEAHKLDMKLVDVEYSFNGSKIVFYFTADGRVDFRDLVKDLAGVLKTRIELRQIGVRDEAKMLGGLGSCGRPVCCKAFLADFQPVSIKMAKEQSLSLSPTKISGLCGRLMCCLKYEQDCYESMRKQMPRVGKDVTTPEGLTGMAIENNVLTERTRVKLILPDGSIDVREYPFRDLVFKARQPQPQNAEQPGQKQKFRKPKDKTERDEQAEGSAPEEGAAPEESDVSSEPKQVQTED
ncbi:MAG: stage 0 sporulation family protein [Christensenellaceae bacterium]|jgi:cell fate regulator YaaT (PSP1 superfamily)|nr:stage 0 sporulation family protein [Christensenellaceae bacterium]